ncbi:ATP-grasp domain-containing protein [Kitasatospora acidiphila]|uniref:ATP-grasp domain-containing protein n=1 Tax=Kitasatospora acidiphila TaxID=2567942 RepID=UPI003C77D7DF
MTTVLTDERRRLLVVYDDGAAGAGELLRSLAGRFELAFLTTDSPHAKEVEPFLRAARPVFRLSQWPANLPALREWKPDGITTYAEMIPETAAVAATLALPFHSPEVADLLTDKWRQRERLRAAGVDATRSYVIQSESDLRPALDHVGLPAVVKPARGKGSRDTFRLDYPQQAVETITWLLASDEEAGRQPRYVLEEMLLGADDARFGDYVSVESVLTPDGPVHLAVTGKFPLSPPFRECGQFWPAAVPAAQDQAIRELTAQAIDALGIRHGLTHTEIKLTPTGPRLIEVNGRLGGWIAELADRALGLDLFALAADLACGPVRMTTPSWPGIVFQFWNLPPQDARALGRVNGAPTVRKMPGIDRYLNLVLPGPLGPAEVTQRLDLTCGTASSYEALTAMIGAAMASLEYAFTDAEGLTTTTAAVGMPSWQALHAHSTHTPPARQQEP